MDSQNPNQKYVDAVSGRVLSHNLEVVKGRVDFFIENLAAYKDGTFIYERDSLVSQAPDVLEINTPMGVLKLRFVNALEDREIAPWVIFFDDAAQPPSTERYLLAVKLGAQGWIGPRDRGYTDMYGRFVVGDVLLDALGEKLRLDTEFVKSINKTD